VNDGSLRWTEITGRFTFGPSEIRYLGGTATYIQGEGEAFGMAMCNQWFGGGLLQADVTFETAVTERSVCDLVLFHNPGNRSFISAGLSNEVLYGVKSFEGRWQAYTAVGDSNRLEANRTYDLECRVKGSIVTLLVQGVEVTTVNLPVPLPQSQVGVWCRGVNPIVVRDFRITSERPTAFVVMQFSAPFNELFAEVIAPICEELGVRAFRADQTYGPGLIIADVVRQIDEAKLVIAEISPVNANVYYEVGYAHARGKPTILIADRAIERLPFDVSGFRTLFYENSIDGKRRVEEGLRRHLTAVLDPSRLSGTTLQPTPSPAIERPGGDRVRAASRGG
jgi:hypothetical protein